MYRKYNVKNQNITLNKDENINAVKRPSNDATRLQMQ